MNTAFDIKLEAKDLFRFNMYQTYTGLQGWISIILGILAFVMAGITFGHAETMYTILYIGVGILFLVYVPGSLWMRANATIKTNAYIIPRTQIGEQYDMFCRIAEKKLEKFRLKLKK